MSEKMSSQSQDFNVIQFEKRLTALKDSQENINACCKWCLENRQFHKKIVNSWLNVLKRVKVEQRLNLFYLANDVIQYSKRKQYEFVDSWGTALQKATTLVRDDKVKHKIVRIFNIWQQRGVYNEEFISDLCGLISVVPTASKNDEPHEFQSSYVINKIKQCSKLETETDLKLKVLKEHNPKIQLETESLCTSLKDRAHVDDVEKELEVYVKHLEGYINALKAEIKCRITNISVLKQANNQLDKDKKDVKVVANAYKVFGNKVKAFQKKLEEHMLTLSSPVPSPDVNAPSPSPDCDIELPDDNEMKNNNSHVEYNAAVPFSAGYYNPVPPPSTEPSNFVTNGYTSFIGSSFNVQNLNTSTLFTNTQTTNTLTEVTNSNYDLSSVLQSIARPPPPPIEPSTETPSFPYQEGPHMPLLPPPMPPFSENSYQFTNTSFTQPVYETAPMGAPDEYNPEQEPETWDTDPSWTQPTLDTDTPESPPNFEKEGYIEGAEYHDNVVSSGVADVDHRLLHPLDGARGRKDVDHRNLISLTGSPADVSSNVWTPSGPDQDYRVEDQDYRLPPFNIEQLKLPPPPPPPPKKILSPRKLQDNTESIDMELSEDETEEKMHPPLLKPPPPLPDLPDDVDANSFLDDLDNDLNSNEFTANLHDPEMGGFGPWRPPKPNFGGFRRGHRGRGVMMRGRGRGFRGANFRARGFRGGRRGNSRGFQGGY
ncbi:hypothetical protein TcasGA2_TC015954 [Tribolium castaneum]|uniref:Regulation of nuclear pre-mRNA domain-containing protein 2 n=1 Tax=Tribolium castaneum TaxID=7070 RepID=D6WU04_TRICA|nr:PREDICTED: uncharacterized protein LOC659425 isoform X1 [Tribolium castaneum]EFA07354.2 hypothetical protein TcasGA2_TC015954 [Tribolium castaneum]|eukprot:XP_970826.2 PREDICTED: uncharacterized protein LOC659425 isoform X1 [Tribolium castaneum]